MNTRTFENGTDFPNGDGAQGGELTKGQLHEEYRHPTNDEHREVRDEESTAAVLVTQIRETPKIPQSDGKRLNQDLLLRSITTCVHTTLAGNRFDRSVSWSFRRVGSRFFALIFFSCFVV